MICCGNLTLGQLFRCVDLSYIIMVIVCVFKSRLGNFRKVISIKYVAFNSYVFACKPPTFSYVFARISPRKLPIFFAKSCFDHYRQSNITCVYNKDVIKKTTFS